MSDEENNQPHDAPFTDAELIDLESRMGETKALSIPQGFSKEHGTVNERLIARVIMLLRGDDIKVNSYAIDEGWNGQSTDEAIKITCGKATINIRISTTN